MLLRRLIAVGFLWCAATRCVLGGGRSAHQLSEVSLRPGLLKPLLSQAADSATKGWVFDVVSIRPTPPDGKMMMMPNGSAETLSARMVTVDSMIAFAYQLPYTQVMTYNPKYAWYPRSPALLGGPAWVGTDHFDITAKADDGTVERWNKLAPKEQQVALREMVGAMLADRFHVTMRHETREVPVWALVVAKGGPKVSPAAAFKPSEPGEPYRSAWTGDLDEIGGTGVTIADFASMLWTTRDLGGRKILDQTGLSGTYSFTLKWTPQDATRDSGPSIFTAIQEQLGLKLEPRRVPMDVLVMDHVERPSEN